MKRLLLTTASMTALLCLGGAASAEDTVVSYRSWSPVIQTLNKMVTATEEALPGIKVDVKVFNYGDFLVDMQTRANAGDLPDLVGLEPGGLTQQYRDRLAPVQDCAVSLWGEDWQSKFYPIGIEQARLGNPEGDENFYGIPLLVQTINLWYTIPAMQDLGLEPPKTYDELKALAEKARAAGYAPMAMGAGDGWIRRDIYMMIIHNIAPGLIYQAEKGEVSWTDPRFVEAMAIWKKFFDDGIFQDGALGLSHYPGAAEIIESGRAATFPMGAWWQQQAANAHPTPLSENLSGYVPFAFPDVTGNGAPEDFLGGIDVMIGITKDANYDAACQVLGDWVSGAGAQELINTFNDLPAFIGLRPAKFGSENQEAVWDMFVNDWLPTVKYARQLASPDVKQAFEDALAAVAAGDKTPEEGMQMVQSAYDASM